MERIVKETFAVIGMEGATSDGEGFIARLWEQANARFGEIAHLVCRDAQGAPAGVWGAMSDYSRSFRPWEKDFSEGLYLAGAECPPDALPPEGWTKWIIPGFEYLRAPVSPTCFRDTLAYIDAQGLALAGAVHDFTDPRTGQGYMLFPIRKL